MNSSIVQEGVSGLILISGLWGSGKSTAALTLERPDMTVMIDLDQKSRSRCEALGVTYFAPSGEGLSDPTDYNLDGIVKWAQSAFREIGQLENKTTLIIDNGTPLEQAYHHLVGKSPAKYGVNPRHAASGSYGGTNPGVGRIWENTITFLGGKGITNIVVCMHMSEMWAGGAPIGKYRVKGNKTLTQLANLSIVLIKAKVPNRPPTAIVGKEALGLIGFDEETGQFQPFMALPPRIPGFTWPVVYEYIRQMREGTKTEFGPDEIPSPQELERYSPWLSDEQRQMVLTVAGNPRFSLSEEDAEKMVERYGGPRDYKSLVGALKDRGWSEEAIKEELKQEFGTFKHDQVPQYWEHLKDKEPTQ